MHDEGSDIAIHKFDSGEIDKNEIDKELLSNLKRAMSTGKWMIAIFRHDGSLHLDWKTNNFPRDITFLDSVRMLCSHMVDDYKDQYIQKLPTANIESIREKIKSVQSGYQPSVILQDDNQDKPETEESKDQEDN